MKLKELFEVLGQEEVILNIDHPDRNYNGQVSGVAGMLRAVLNDSMMDAAVTNIVTCDGAIGVDVEVCKHENPDGIKMSRSLSGSEVGKNEES